MLRKTVTIKDENFYCEDDIYTDWFYCPKCNESMIFAGASYCPDCGVKLKWETSGDNSL